ncbi:TonB-dependent receptor [Seleniivibrio sp.]|uniref:TonB-dependent receptor n=1 Tax=Seleniivibrio sp. TaxID=2898801 RepID=UPI0025FA3E5E|nr:TonB-dependent receptor [Seleniivibrio sp.]MCD8553616.1 TonB-dependent receptor [Seleniivibrio sp.]
MKRFLFSVFLLSGIVNASAQEELVIDQINVTAQKYEEKQYKTPLSIDAYDEADISSKDVSELKDLSNYSANVHIKSDNVGNSVVIRGVAPFTTTLVNPVGVYIDGVALPTLFMQQPDLSGVQRIEILKGPQGTLYGRNSESGVINIITKKPDNIVNGYISAEYYVYDTGDNPYGTKYSFDVSGPMVKDRFFVGLSAVLNRTDGYFKNIYNGDDKAGELDRKDLTFKLRALPSAKSEVYFSSYYYNADDAKGKFRVLDGTYATPQYSINYNDKYTQSYDGWVNSLSYSYELNGYTITSTTGYTDYSREFSKDFDGTSQSQGLSVLDLEDTALSEELKISRKTNSYKFIGGLYAFTQDTDTVFEKTFTKEKRTADTENKGYAVFGQFSPRITESFYVDLGLRIEQSSIDSDMDYAKASALYKFSDSQTYTQVLPKLSLNFETESGLLYASVAKGYLAGGVNYNLATSDESLLYGAEHTINYELGYKAVLASGRLGVNAAVFYTDMKDKQVSQVISGEAGNVKISNASKAHAYGAEISANYKAAKGLTLFSSAGLTKSFADDWIDSQYNSSSQKYTYTDYSGNRLPTVPEHTFDIGFEYIHPSGFFISGDSVYTGGFYYDGANNLKEGAYVLYNARTGYLWDHIELTLWCENLTDTSYTESQSFMRATTVAEDGKPRTFGVKIAYRY